MSIQVTRLEGLTPQGQRAFENHVKSVSAVIQTLQNASKSIVSQVQINSLQAQITVLNNAITALQNSGSNETAATSPIVEQFAVTGSPPAFPYAVYETGSGVCAPADTSTLASQAPLLGIAASNAPGGQINVTTFGDCTYTGWSWTPNMAVYVGSNGALTQNPGTGVPLQAIGVAATATLLRVGSFEMVQNWAPGGYYEVLGDQLVPEGQISIMYGPMQVDGTLRNDGKIVGIQ